MTLRIPADDTLVLRNAGGPARTAAGARAVPGRLGRYQILGELGKGAMGVVYRARDPMINREVALKAIPLAEEFEGEELVEARGKFFREAEMAGRLSHPHIVTIYDAGEHAGVAYIAMELLRGQQLVDCTSGRTCCRTPSRSRWWHGSPTRCITGVISPLPGYPLQTGFWNVLIRLTRFVNRLLRPFIHRDYLSEEHGREFAHESVEGIHELLQKPGIGLLSLFLAVLAKSLQAFNLMLIFLAFGIPFSVGTIIAAFSLIMLFVVISPTPGGVGVVEGTMPLILSSFGIPLGTAVVLMLAYRGTSFWPQVLLGIPSLRLISKAPK